MGRKRPAARAYRSPAAKRFENPFAMVMLTPQTFHEMLPTSEDRQAFAAAFPYQFWSMLECVADPESERFPTTEVVAAGCCAFRRPLGFYKRLRPKAPFDPPDLRGVPYRECQRKMAQARAAFWQANKLKMTPEEQAWLANPPATGTDQENTIRMKGKNHD